MPQESGIGGKADYGEGRRDGAVKKENLMEWVRRVNEIKVRVEKDVVN